jgi:glycosidase
MMDAFNKAGIQVMVDIVPNHSSDDHVWFQEALKSPIGSAARDRYIFRDGESPSLHAHACKADKQDSVRRKTKPHPTGTVFSVDPPGNP